MISAPDAVAVANSCLWAAHLEHRLLCLRIRPAASSARRGWPKLVGERRVANVHRGHLDHRLQRHLHLLYGVSVRRKLLHAGCRLHFSDMLMSKLTNNTHAHEWCLYFIVSRRSKLSNRQQNANAMRGVVAFVFLLVSLVRRSEHDVCRATFTIFQTAYFCSSHRPKFAASPLERSKRRLAAARGT